jgi:hypothetical protein
MKRSAYKNIRTAKPATCLAMLLVSAALTSSQAHALRIDDAATCVVESTGEILVAKCETPVSPGTLFRFDSPSGVARYQVISRAGSLIKLVAKARGDDKAESPQPGALGVAGAILDSSQTMKLSFKGLVSGAPNVPQGDAKTVDPAVASPDLQVEITQDGTGFKVGYSCLALGARSAHYDILDQASQRSILRDVRNAGSAYVWWNLTNKFSLDWAHRDELSPYQTEPVAPGDKIALDFRTPFEGYLCVLALDYDGTTRVLYPSLADAPRRLAGETVYPVSFTRDIQGQKEKALCRFSLTQRDDLPTSFVAIYSRKPLSLAHFCGASALGRLISYRSKLNGSVEEVNVNPWQIGPGIVDLNAAEIATTNPDELDARDWMVSHYSFPVKPAGNR